MDGMQSLKIRSELGERTYNRDRGGQMAMPDKDARTAIREGVAVPASVAGPTAHLRGGYTCGHCGRRNFFRRCGKCEET
jgi:hypothetical protein